MSRIGNVAGAVLWAAEASQDAVSAAWGLLELLFEEVRVIRAPGDEVAPLALLVEALEGSGAERVVVVDPTAPPPSAALLLALTAYPEHDWVRLDRHPAGCAIVRCEPVLAAARARLAAGDRDLSSLTGDEAGLSRATIAGSDLEVLTG